MKHITVFLFVAFVSTVLAQPTGGDAASGEVVASVQSGPWSDPSSWDCGCIPGASHDISIVDGHSVSVAATDTVRAETLGISAGAILNLPEGALLEVTESFASAGDVEGDGRVVFVGEGPHVCGPASLTHLDCGTGDMTLAGMVTVSSNLNLSSANVTTGGLLKLEGPAGITSGSGSLTGGVIRRFDWTKSSPYTHQMGTGMSGITASALLDQPGAVYVKKWNEPSTSYTTLVDSDVLDSGAGFTCSLPPGTYGYQMQGEAVLEADIAVTAEAASASWRGWNLLCNPLTGYVDLNATVEVGPGTMGAIYQWVDSLQTWVAQVGGIGQFGRAGILAPGDAFWAIADTAFTWTLDASALVEEAEWRNQTATLPDALLSLQMDNGVSIEQCAVLLDGGNAAYERAEDAMFSSSFRGRNNLDLYTWTADSVSVMVNRTTAVSQVIPVWIKAGSGDLITLEAPSVPSNFCLILEDIETGWTGGIEPGFTYEFSPTIGSDHHRFNLIVGNDMVAEPTDAACESAMDGTISVSGPEGLTAGFALVDAEGAPAGEFDGSATSGTFTGLSMGTYTVTALTDGCADIVRTVEVGAGGSGESPFDIVSMPDHIGCYEDEGGVSLDIEGGLAPYTVTWDHGAEGADIEVGSAGLFSAVITDAAGCSDSTIVEVLAAPHVQAGIGVDEPVVALIDGEAEVAFTNASSGATQYQWNFGDGNVSAEPNPLHFYAAAGAYTVGLNAWNDYCSDTHQIVVNVEVVNSVGSLSNGADPVLERQTQGWSILHPEEAFLVQIFDLTGRQIHEVRGAAGVPVILDGAVLPAVSLIHWAGETTGRQKTWRLAR